MTQDQFRFSVLGVLLAITVGVYGIIGILLGMAS